MKKLFIIVFVSLAWVQSNAQNKQQSVSELISILNSEQTTEKMFDNMLQLMKQQNAKELTQEQQDELSVFIISTMKEITKKAVNDYYPSIYDKYFTEKDLNRLIKFYKSPTGQKYLKVTPDIQKELMQNYMMADLLNFQKKVEQKRKEIKEDN